LSIGTDTLSTVEEDFPRLCGVFG